MRSSPASMARPAFTLLEMILAATIAVLLLGALYVAVNLQLQHADSAREVVTQAKLARQIFNKITTDIAPDLTTVDPLRYQPPAQSGSGGSGGSGMAGASGGAGMTGGNGAGASGTGMSGGMGASGSGTNGGAGANGSNSGANSGSNNGSSTSQSSTSSTSTAGTNGLAVITMQGTSNTITLFTSRMPPVQNGAANALVLSDQHRIVYWLVEGVGLARQDVTAVTSDDAQNLNIPSGPPDPNSKQLLAKEVRSLQFQYFDGSAWNDSWDGTQLGADGITPIGSPVAVAVTIGIALPDSDEVKSYRHVISIPTANNPTAAQSAAAAANGTGSGASSP